MMLGAIFLHVLGVVVWMGGVMYQAHVLLPMARRGHAAAFAAAARRARPVAWTALALVVLTGLYNVTRLGPLDRVMQSAAAMLLAGKLGLVLVLVAVAGQRDFSQVTRLNRLVASGGDAASALSSIAWLDRISLVLGIVIIYLGLAISRS
jgi:uncharacterized membrane protein